MGKFEARPEMLNENYFEKKEWNIREKIKRHEIFSFEKSEAKLITFQKRRILLCYLEFISTPQRRM